MSRFLAQDKNRKEDQFVAEVWDRRNILTSSTYDAITAAVWPEHKGKESQNAASLNFKTTMSRANTSLDKFCREEFYAKRLPFYLSIETEWDNKTKREYYRIAPQKRISPLVPPSELLWDACITDDSAPLIISTEPVVFQDENGRCFIRFLDINSAPADGDKTHMDAEIQTYLEELKDSDPKLEAAFRTLFERLRPCYHYQPSGEVLGALSAASWFLERHPPDRRRPPVRLLSRQVNRELYHPKNALILGSLRTNFLIREHQELHQPPIRLTGRDIRIAKLAPYVDNRQEAYALVTRSAATPTEKERTIVGANNGRAVHAAVEALLHDQSVSKLFAELHAPSGYQIPKNFQVLYRVNLDEHNVQGNNCTVVRACEF